MTQLTNCGVITLCYLCWSTEMCWHPSSLRRHCAAFSNREKLSGWQCAVLGNSGTLVVLVTFTTKKTKSENDWSCIYKCFATDDTLKSPTCHYQHCHSLLNTLSFLWQVECASCNHHLHHCYTVQCTPCMLQAVLSLGDIPSYGMSKCASTGYHKRHCIYLQYLLPIMHTYAHMHKQHINSTSLFTFTLACSLVHSIN